MRIRTWWVASRFAICLAVVCAADAWFVREAREAAGGVLCPTTDDAFIHLQYARSFAELRPLVYQPGDPPTTGATSVLFPMCVALGFGLGLSGLALVWVANAVSTLALAATMTAAWSFAERAIGRHMGPGAALAVVACPTFTLLALGGMEVGLSTGLHLAATLGAVLFWLDPTLRVGPTALRRATALATLGALSALARPEGLASALVVAATLALRPIEGRPRASRVLSLLTPLPWLLPPLVALVTTGSPSTTGTLIKFMPADPFRTWDETTRILAWNAKNVFERIFLGRAVERILVYQAMPRFTYLLFGLGAVGLYRAFVRRAGRDGRLAFLAWAASGSVIFGTLLYTWIGNMGRYVLAFAPILVLTSSLGIAALAAELLERRGARERSRALASTLVPLLVSAAFVVAPSSAVRQHAEATREICAQQVAMASRVRELPPDAVVAVNDAGAIAYLGEHRTWDLIGLTSPGAAVSRLSGVGSVFERLERLPATERPTHAAIYPGWFFGFEQLGRAIDRKSVDGPYVGGPTKVLYELDAELYDSGARPPRLEPARAVVDELDAADVASEREHAYAAPEGRLSRAVLIRATHDGRTIVDGVRPIPRGDRATLRAEAGRPAVLATRLVAQRGAGIEVRWNGARHVFELPPREGFQDIFLELPPEAVETENRLERNVVRGGAAVAHDWLLQ